MKRLTKILFILLLNLALFSVKLSVNNNSVLAQATPTPQFGYCACARTTICQVTDTHCDSGLFAICDGTDPQCIRCNCIPGIPTTTIIPTVTCVPIDPTRGNYYCSWNYPGCTISSQFCQPGWYANCSDFGQRYSCENFGCSHNCVQPTPTGADPTCSPLCGQLGHYFPVCRTSPTPAPPYAGCQNMGYDCNLQQGQPADCYCCPATLTYFLTRPPLNPICPYNSEGISTAIGCIPVGDQNLFLAFILRWALGIAGGIAFLLIIYAGFIYMTSGGDKQKVQAAKELLTAAISGLLLLIFSVFLLDLFGVRILQIPGIV